MDAYFKLTGYKPHTILQNLTSCIKHLKLAKFILQCTADAIHDFYNKANYHHFDAHVGDAMCQIRALKLLELSTQKMPNAQAYISHINLISSKIDLKISKLESKTVEERRYFKPATLANFFLDTDLFFNVSNDVEFLVKCYLLTKYKKYLYHFDARIDILKLQKDLKTGISAIKGFIHYLQVSLSTLSVSYIKTIADKNNIFLETLIMYDSNSRPILPCYLLTILILRKLKELKSEILVLIRENKKQQNVIIIPLVFQYHAENDSYHFHDQKPIENNTYFVLNCYSDILSPDNIAQYQQKIANLSIENLFLYVTAHHPQYSPDSLSSHNGNTYCYLLDDATVLLTEYEADKLNYVNVLLDDRGQHICQIEHISMGTLDTHDSVYRNLGFGNLSLKLIEDVVDG